MLNKNTKAYHKSIPEIIRQKYAANVAMIQSNTFYALSSIIISMHSHSPTDILYISLPTGRKPTAS